MKLINVLVTLAATVCSVGVANASSRGSNGNVLLTSARDTIVCETFDGYSCGVRSLSPSQWAGNAGYKTLWKTSILVTEKYNYIVMEVSK